MITKVFDYSFSYGISKMARHFSMGECFWSEHYKVNIKLTTKNKDGHFF